MFKSLKRVTASLITAAFIATTVAPAALAADVLTASEFKIAASEAEQEEIYYGHPFTDVHPRYNDAVDFLYFLDITKGKSPTEFGTYDNLTRGDAAVMLAEILWLDTENAPDAGFADLNDRVRGSVNALAAEGIISGVTEDKFEPQKPLSRGAMAKILVRGFGLEEYAVSTPFTDATGVFQPYIEALYGAEITTGKTPTTYGTHEEIIRGDFANLLYNTFMFTVEDTFYYADSAEMVNSSTLSVSYAEPIPEDITAEDAAYMTLLYAIFSDGSEMELTASNAVFSEDRKTLTFNHEDLAGKKGTLLVDELELEFDYE